MTVLLLKTELDVATVLLAKGWRPGDINGVLVFPLPESAFHHIGNQIDAANQRANQDMAHRDIISVTNVTPTTVYRARQLLQSSGWQDRELNSLLRLSPYRSPLTGTDPTATNPWLQEHQHRLDRQQQKALNRYRRDRANRRMLSLAVVISLVVWIILSLD